MIDKKRKSRYKFYGCNTVDFTVNLQYNSFLCKTVRKGKYFRITISINANF